MGENAVPGRQSSTTVPFVLRATGKHIQVAQGVSLICVTGFGMGTRQALSLLDVVWSPALGCDPLTYELLPFTHAANSIQ
jgi:hypothetical protein